MSRQRFGIGVVGCGMMAQGMHLPNIARHPDLELRWCCDVDPAMLESACSRFHPARSTSSAQDVASDPDCDIVLLATSHNVRAELIELFARAGKHIYVEKPMAESFGELQRVLRAVRAAGIKFTVGHNRRMAQAVREATRVLEGHRFSPEYPLWRWNRDGVGPEDMPCEASTMVLLRVNDDYWSWKKWAFARGALVNEMTHFCDLAGVFIPSCPVRVAVTGSRLGNHTISVEYADGSIASVFGTVTGTFGYPKELVEVYHNGSAIIIDHLSEVRVAGIPGQPFRTVFPFPNDPFPDIEATGIEGYYERTWAMQKRAVESGDLSLLPPQPDKGHYALLTDLIQAIRDNRQPVCAAPVAAVATAIVLRALESEANGGIPTDILPSDYTLEV